MKICLSVILRILWNRTGGACAISGLKLGLARPSRKVASPCLRQLFPCVANTCTGAFLKPGVRRIISQLCEFRKEDPPVGRKHGSALLFRGGHLRLILCQEKIPDHSARPTHGKQENDIVQRNRNQPVAHATIRLPVPCFWHLFLRCCWKHMDPPNQTLYSVFITVPFITPKQYN